jgi:DNA-binding MarR family transcriptional regulator
MSRHIELLEELLHRISNSIRAMAKQTRNYAGKIQSSPQEAHLIEVIHNHPSANTTDIASILGLTKGSVSQRAATLCKKGLIEKFKQENNNKEIYYRLTPAGQQVHDAHMLFHARQNRQIYQKFESFTTEEKEFICDFLKDYAQYLEDSYFPK